MVYFVVCLANLVWMISVVVFWRCLLQYISWWLCSSTLIILVLFSFFVYLLLVFDIPAVKSLSFSCVKLVIKLLSMHSSNCLISKRLVDLALVGLYWIFWTSTMSSVFLFVSMDLLWLCHFWRRVQNLIL